MMFCWLIKSVVSCIALTEVAPSPNNPDFVGSIYMDGSPSPGPAILCEDDEEVVVEVDAPRPAIFICCLIM